MNVDVAYAFAMQGMAFDEVQDLVAVCDDGRRQILQQFEDRAAFAQVSTSYLADHERMHHDGRTLQQVYQARIATAQVVNPDRRVDQDQADVPDRLRGAAFSAACVPPKRARRLALSR